VRQRDYLFVYIAGGLLAAGIAAIIGALGSPPSARTQTGRTRRARRATAPMKSPWKNSTAWVVLLAEGGDCASFTSSCPSHPRIPGRALRVSDSLEMTTEELVAAMRRVPLESARRRGRQRIEAGCRLATW